jgi:AcrR family transcriptional regulator
MPKTEGDSRTRLLQAAEKTTYLYGFGSTSLADIAKAAEVPLGNIYYYFKTKDEIGGAIVELHVRGSPGLDGEAIRGAWQRNRFPRLRRTSSIRNARRIRTRPHLPRSKHDRHGGRAAQGMDSSPLTQSLATQHGWR